MFSNKAKVALKLSLMFWLLGAILAIPFMFFKLDVLYGIKLALLINPFILLFLSRLYLKKSGSKKPAKDGFLFGLFLAITHIPADVLFISLFFKEALVLFSTYLGALFYGEMIVFSAMGGLIPKPASRPQLPHSGRP